MIFGSGKPGYGPAYLHVSEHPSSMQVVSQQQVEGQRNMKGETSGRQGGPAAGSAVAKQGKVSKAAKKCSEVDQLFDQLKKSTSTTDSKVEQQQVQCACRHACRYAACNV